MKDIYFYSLYLYINFDIALRTGGYSDTYYQLTSFYWFIFFFLLTPQFEALFFSSKDQKIFFQNSTLKFFIVFLMFMVSVVFFKKHFISLYSKSGTLKNTVMNIRVLNNNCMMAKEIINFL